jgi:hypothetical protein
MRCIDHSTIASKPSARCQTYATINHNSNRH